jgi:hypothetical protein
MASREVELAKEKDRLARFGGKFDDDFSLIEDEDENENEVEEEEEND